MSDRKHKFPCSEHTWPAMQEKKERLKDRPMDEWWLTQKELDVLYHGECVECRDSYKTYSRYILFTTKFWDFKFRFTYPRWSFYKYIYQHQGLGEVLKRFFGGIVVEYSNPEFAHAYWYTWFHLFMFHWREYEFYDVYGEDIPYIDLDKLKEYNYKYDGDDEIIRSHQVKVLRRFNKMFEKQLRLKDKSECDVDEWWTETCERGTLGCAHHPKQEKK